MCILMYFGPGALPIRDHLDVACENNPDGFGYGIVTRDGIITGHGMDPDRVIEEFITVRNEFPDDTALFHARIATQGSVCMDNCHPFTVEHRSLKPHGNATVSGEMVLAHNGMLPVYPGKGDDRSDTKLFAEEIFMRRFPHLDAVKTRRRIETYLGGSKLVILTTDPAYQFQAYIFNERLGIWIDHEGTGDIWYSNTSYKEYRYSAYTNRGMGAYTAWSWPTTVGASKDSDAWQDPDMRLACSVCRYALVFCMCTGSIKGVYLPSGQVRVPTGYSSAAGYPVIKEEDETVTWTCLMCETSGDVDDDGMCRQCGTMICCNRSTISCVCWDPHTKRLRSKEERERWDNALDYSPVATGQALDHIIDALS